MAAHQTEIWIQEVFVLRALRLNILALKGQKAGTGDLPHAGAELAERALQIPWRTNILLIERVKEPALRLAYMNEAIQNGWSRNVLSIQIDNRTCEREGKAFTNFDRTLPPADSDMAQQTLPGFALRRRPSGYGGTSQLRRGRS